MIRLFKVFCDKEKAIAGVSKSIDSGYIGQGERVEEFERRLQNLLGYKKIFATCSGTAALDLAYHLVGINPDSTVITTPATCTATNVPLKNRHAKIIWSDVIPETGLIDPRDVARKITKDTKAIVACDWGGMPCNYPELKKFGIPVIQDGAHSFMCDDDGGKLRGDYRMWSFQAIKQLTTADGGALSVPEDQEERCELLRWYGLDRRKGFSFRCKQDIPEAGYKYGMNDIAASIGIANIEGALWCIDRNRENARYYSERLSRLDRLKVKAPKYTSASTWWLYTLIVDNQEKFIEHMAGQGIEASPVHSRNDTKTCFAAAGGVYLPGVDFFSSHEVCIPVGWWLSKQERERVALVVENYCDRI